MPRPKGAPTIRALHRRARPFSVATALALVYLGLAPRSAAAHQSSVAYSDIVVDGREIFYTIKVSSADLYEAVGIDKDRPVTRDEVERGKGRLLAYLLARIHVESGGTACSGAPAAGLDFIDKSEGFFAAAHFRYGCPRTVETASVRYELFFDIDPRHQGMVRIAFGSGDEGREQVFTDGARTIEIRRELSIWDHGRDYLLLGIEHIFTGYDHIAFLFGLLVVAGAAGLRRGAKSILGVVSAFTLAHSVTLIASALGWVALPSRIVEPAIALSIVYVGVENLVDPAPRHRFALTFGFGLIHGFGFASVLREIGLPQKGLLLSLVSFNVGVEVGQLAVVAAVLPLLAIIAARDPSSGVAVGVAGASRKLAPAAAAAVAVLAVAACTFALFRRFDVPAIPLGAVTFGGAPLLYVFGRTGGYDRVVRLFGSTAIVLFALYWFTERVLGKSFFGGMLG